MCQIVFIIDIHRHSNELVNDGQKRPKNPKAANVPPAGRNRLQ